MANVFITADYLPSKEFGAVLKQYNDFFSEPIRQYLEAEKNRK